MEGTSDYRIVLSKFDAVSFFELIVMRASGNMITDFLHISWFPRQSVPKEQTSTKFQNLDFLIFHLILMGFFSRKMLIFMSYLWIKIENELLWFYRKWAVNVDQILKFRLHGRSTQLMFFILFGRRGRDRMVVGFATTYAISAYHRWCCEFESRSGRGVQQYVIKFVSDLRQVCGFLRFLRFPPPIKLTATI